VARRTQDGAGIYFSNPSAANCPSRLSQGILERCIGCQQSERIFQLEEDTNLMTLLEISTVWIALLLFALAISAWIIARRRSTRNWDFKQRSLEYLNDVDRQRRRIPVPRIRSRNRGTLESNQNQRAFIVARRAFHLRVMTCWASRSTCGCSSTQRLCESPCRNLHLPDGRKIFNSMK